MKEVKKQLGSKNFYLYLFQQIKAGVRPSKISKNLGISKQALNYYIATLKRNGFIKKVGYGVWEVVKDFNVKEVKKTTKVAPNKYHLLKEGKVRAHGLQFKLKLPNIPKWKERAEKLRQSNILFKDLIIGGIRRGEKIEFKGRKIWLTDNSIIIYEKASYFGDNAEEAKNYAIYEFRELLASLERYLEVNLKINGNYLFRISRQHYALIKNTLAKQYDKEGKKLEVYNDTGLWFVIDNSFNLHEAETQGKRAVQANEKVKTFFNEVEELEGYSPKMVLSAVAQNTKNLDYHAENMRTHVGAVKKLASAVDELTAIMKELKKEKGL